MKKLDNGPGPALTELFHLYCFNRECLHSIYYDNCFSKPLTAANFCHHHTCDYCNKRLVSLVDLEIKRLSRQDHTGELIYNSGLYMN